MVVMAPSLLTTAKINSLTYQTVSAYLSLNIKAIRNDFIFTSKITEQDEVIEAIE